MLIEKYQLRVISPPCDPGSERWTATAMLEADITEALPYLNARLRGAIYDHAVPVLVATMGGHRVSFRPLEFAVSNLEDRGDAQVVVERIIEMVNSTWSQRDRIEPSLRRREPLKAMEVFKLLPRSNCKVCGYPTCFTFAAAVTANQATIEACQPLMTADYASQRDSLLALVQAAQL